MAQESNINSKANWQYEKGVGIYSDPKTENWLPAFPNALRLVIESLK